eukprot:6203413-Pleurochrysis_carterae.AAC.1
MREVSGASAMQLSRTSARPIVLKHACPLPHSDRRAGSTTRSLTSSPSRSPALSPPHLLTLSPSRPPALSLSGPPALRPAGPLAT